MSSPSPGPNSGAQSVAGILNVPVGPRRVATSGGFPHGSSSNPAPRPITPPSGQQQHSPNSFLANLSSRIMQRNIQPPPSAYSNPGRGLTDILDSVGGPGSSLLNSFRGNHPNFGIATGGAPPPPLDLSEFPSLGSHSGPGSLLGSGGAPGSNRPPYVGMVNKDHAPGGSSSTGEFTVHLEDFPALPGSSSNPMQLGAGNRVSEEGVPGGALGSGQGLSGILGPGPNVPPSSIIGSGANIGSSSSGDGSSTGSGLGSGGSGSGKGGIRRGIQTTKEGRVSNIPAGMVTDQFGMVGLLTFIRAAETDPNLVSLALGTDLTTLKLDLNSSESLYSSFPGPWSETPLKTHEIDFPVPQEYLINNQIRDKLAPIKLGRYGDDTLFFLFYLFPNDMIQVAAASELYVRDWRYHKDDKVWITRAPGMPPTEKTGTYERGTYYFFDAINWRRVAKEFHLDYDRLENRPPTAAYNHVAAAASAGNMISL